jgi:hypothetical protein
VPYAIRETLNLDEFLVAPGDNVHRHPGAGRSRLPAAANTSYGTSNRHVVLEKLLQAIDDARDIVDTDPECPVREVASAQVADRHSCFLVDVGLEP